MGLKEELGFETDFHSQRHEALLAVYHTTSLLRKRADMFFQHYGLTDVQFNVLVIVHFQGGEAGLSQVALSRMMLVNRANITSLVDRMERAGLVKRVDDPEDRRSKRVVLTRKGQARLEETYEGYKTLVRDVTEDLSDAEVTRLLTTLTKIRRAVNAG